jgi:hypothetical protein
LLGFAAFLAVIGYLIAASMVKPRLAEFSPTPPGTAPGAGPGPDTVTIDATDESQWRFYSFTRGVLSPPDTAGSDLGFRRYHVIASGSAADLGLPAPGGRSASPSLGGGAVAAATVFARDSVNPALAHWYQYGFLTHLLRPDGHVFLVETRGGARARMEFLSYYCPGSQPGCLTFRWAWVSTPGTQRRPFR